MYGFKRISNIFSSADEILFDDSSKFILMSDCHRGDGNWADNFSNNQNIYFAALNHYYKKGYSYIELGDGDELWENSKMSDIIEAHSHVFWLMSKFYSEKRLYMIYGNHDIVKKKLPFIKKNLYQYLDERENKMKPLFENIKTHEGLVLQYKKTGDQILLIHGHQVDFLNSDLWKLNRFLVRTIWKPLETFGVNDITRTAKNYKKRNLVAKKLSKWVSEEKYLLVAGHNHKPAFPEVGEIPYFNDGSCVHPRCITGIEIENGEIMLVKWSVEVNERGYLYIRRNILAGPRRLEDYFKLQK